MYFPALGLGFLFIEIFLIEKASLWLNDRTSGFALVLTGMLVFSGLGSMLADRLAAAPRRRSRWRASSSSPGAARCWWRCSRPSWPRSDLPWLARAALVLAVLAPVSVALGLPFPLGLARTGSGGLLPWAWGLNGAFSVVATPLANLIAREAGLQPGSVLRRGAVCDRAGDVSGNKEEPRVAASFRTITRRGVISAAGALRPGAPRRGAAPAVDARPPTRRR